MFPVPSWAKEVAAAVLVAVLLVALGYSVGYHQESKRFEAYKAEQARVVSDLKAKSEKINTVTVTQYVDRIQVVHEKGETIEKEIVKYVPRNTCVLPADVRRLLNDSTGSPVPGSPGAADAAPEATGETSWKGR